MLVAVEAVEMMSYLQEVMEAVVMVGVMLTEKQTERQDRPIQVVGVVDQIPEVHHG
jgi:hypothetical protein